MHPPFLAPPAAPAHMHGHPGLAPGPGFGLVAQPALSPLPHAPPAAWPGGPPPPWLLAGAAAAVPPPQPPPQPPPPQPPPPPREANGAAAGSPPPPLPPLDAEEPAPAAALPASGVGEDAAAARQAGLREAQPVVPAAGRPAAAARRGLQRGLARLREPRAAPGAAAQGAHVVPGLPAEEVRGPPRRNPTLTPGAGGVLCDADGEACAGRAAPVHALRRPRRAGGVVAMEAADRHQGL